MFEQLIRKLCFSVAKRLPYRVIPRPDGGPYLVRYYLVGATPNDEDRGRRFKVFLHRFLSGDEEEELHNHPWEHSVSLILTGGYEEERRLGDFVVRKTVRPGTLNFIDADDFHRVELREDDAWTLFFAGKLTGKSWGFWDRKTKEYIPWREQIFVRRRQRVTVEA